MSNNKKTTYFWGLLSQYETYVKSWIRVRDYKSPYQTTELYGFFSQNCSVEEFSPPPLQVDWSSHTLRWSFVFGACQATAAVLSFSRNNVLGSLGILKPIWRTSDFFFFFFNKTSVQMFSYFLMWKQTVFDLKKSSISQDWRYKGTRRMGVFLKTEIMILVGYLFSPSPEVTKTFI